MARFAAGLALAAASMTAGHAAPGDDADGQGATTAAGTRIVEVRTYRLVPGSREAFHRLVVDEALPLLQRAGVDVVAFGPSLHDEDTYVLIRSFTSLEDRQAQEDAFYGSDSWRRGPREAVLARIETYTTLVLRLSVDTVAGLGQDLAGTRNISFP